MAIYDCFQYFNEDHIVDLRLNILDQYVDYMYAKDFSEALPMFWKATRKLDKIRGHSIEKSIPELYELLKDTEVNEL